MKMIIKLFGASLFLIANLTFADVIYFDNGDIDEGFVSINDNIMTITSQDKKGEYVFNLNMPQDAILIMLKKTLKILLN